MNWTRRDFLHTAFALPGGAWLANYRALAAPYARMVKITAIKTLQLDNVGDGCLIRIETDSGLSVTANPESTPIWPATGSRPFSRP